MNEDSKTSQTDKTATEDQRPPFRYGPRGDHKGHGFPHGRGRLWRLPLIVAAVVLVKGVVAMWLWNSLIPQLFAGPVLTYVQAVGLLILAKLAVGGGGPRPFGMRGGFGAPWSRWKEMPIEERLKLREQMHQRWHQQRER